MRSDLFARTRSQKAMRHLVCQGFGLFAKSRRKQANAWQNWWQTECKVSAEPQESTSSVQGAPEIWPAYTSIDLRAVCHGLVCYPGISVLVGMLKMATGELNVLWHCSVSVFQNIFLFLIMFLFHEKVLYPSVILRLRISLLQMRSLIVQNI